MLRLGLLAIPATQMPLGFVPPAAAQGPSWSRCHRRVRGSRGRDRSRPRPQELQGSPAARGAGQGRQAPARPGADGPGSPRRQAAARDREIQRRVAPSSAGPFDTSNSRRVAQNDKLLFYDYTGRQAGAGCRAPGKSAPGRQGHHAPAPPRDEVERRPPLARRRLRLLVPRTSTRTKIVPTPAVPMMTIGGQRHHHREDQREHHPVRLSQALLRATHRCSPPWVVGHHARFGRFALGGFAPARYLKTVPSEIRVEG